MLRFRVAQPSAEPVEVPVDDFFRSLDIDVNQLGAPCRYLLFAGVAGDGHAGGRQLAATFTSEASAREAFGALRLARPRPEDWAEVTSVEASGRLRSLCWFGAPWDPTSRSMSGYPGDHPLSRRAAARKSRVSGWRNRRRLSRPA